MLPDKSIKCHRTGFTKTCYEGVVKHKCRLWCHLEGVDAMNKPVDVFGCGDELSLKLMHEVAKEMRQAAASTDKVATEVEKSRNQATAEHVQMIGGLKATLPVLHMIDKMSGQDLLQLEEGGDERQRERQRD